MELGEFFELIECPTKHRKLVSKSIIKQSQLVLKDISIATAWISKCICSNASEFKCPNCDQNYCSKSCQGNDKDHQILCGQEDEVILLHQVHQNKDIMFNTLLSHLELLPKDELLEINSIASRYISLSGSELPLDKVSNHISIFRRNNFSMFDENLHVYGKGTFPIASLLNHSCYPNCIVKFKKSEISVIALRDIPKGDELTIAYIDPITNYAARQKDLRERYYFECKCEFCGLKLPITNITNSYTTIDDSQLAIILEFFDSKKQDPNYFNLLIPFRKTLNQNLIAVTTYTKLSKEMYDHIDQNQWVAAKTKAQICFWILVLYYPPFHPMIGIQSFLCAKLAWNAFLDLGEYLEISKTVFSLNRSEGLICELEEFVKITKE